MATSAIATYPSKFASMDRSDMDAARALVGVAPLDSDESIDIDPAATLASFSRFSGESSPSSSAALEGEEPTVGRRPRSDSAGLDALAALASQESLDNDDGTSHLKFASSVVMCSSSSDDDDFEQMPPPPPRGRRRSASNPEGMEKWDSLGQNTSRGGRRHFVLPASILEVELAEASAAVQSHSRKLPLCIPEDEELLVPTNGTTGRFKPSKNKEIEDSEEEEEEIDEANMTPQELLRRARSRLLEDLSEGSVSGEKGVLSLPHSLGKYKQVGLRHSRWFFNHVYVVCSLADIAVRYRCTIRMDGLGSTPQASEQQSSIVITKNDRDVYGTKRSGTIVEKV